MPDFSQKSINNLTTCDRDLQELFFHVITSYDCTIIEGYRPESKQKELYDSGKSKVLHSKHNESPSLAVDVGPYIQGRGIPWPQTPDWSNEAERNKYVKDLAQFYHFAGWVEGTARWLGLQIRWGGDWDRDHNLSDQSFNDLVHYELLRSTT